MNADRLAASFNESSLKVSLKEVPAAAWNLLIEEADPLGFNLRFEKDSVACSKP